MTVASPTESAARAVQKDIDKLQEELHSSACQVMSAANLKKNVHFSARHAVLNKAMESGELSRTFWADTIITIFSAFSAAGEKRHEKIENKTTDENEDENDDDGLLGPFDALLLREYLQDMRVEYTTGSTKVILTFKPNPFFEETQLWAEMMQELSDDNKEENNNDKEKDGEDGEDENDDTADGYRFSDITWKPGHGPENDDDDDDDENDNKNNNKNNNKGAITKTHSGVKRDRNESATRGWSILEKFSIMPPHPEELDDEELEDDDDDDELQEELALATQEWEAEMEDRKEFLQVLVEDVWANPLLAAAAQNIIINNNNNKEKKTTTDNGEPVKHCVRTE